MGAIDPMGHCQFGPYGLDKQDLYRRAVNIATYKLWVSWSQKKIFLSLSHYKSMGAFCCHDNQSSNPISPKFPTYLMLYMIEMTDGLQMDNRSLPHY